MAPTLDGLGAAVLEAIGLRFWDACGASGMIKLCRWRGRRRRSDPENPWVVGGMSTADLGVPPAVEDSHTIGESVVGVGDLDAAKRPVVPVSGFPAVRVIT